MPGHVIGVDLAALRGTDGKRFGTLAWGTPVEVLEQTPERIRVHQGFVRNKPGVIVDADAARVLRLDFVDVQQGDGAVLETPRGQVVLIDGGRNDLFARYLASRYRGTKDTAPKEIAAIVVTHGDADHFEGLTRIVDSEQLTGVRRLFAHPERVFHNGLVKRPDGTPVEAMFGDSEPIGDTPLITGLVDDLRTVPDVEMNSKFKAWKRALEHFATRGEVKVERLQRGDRDEFGFLAEEDVEVEVLGPLPETRGAFTGLPFLRQPERRFGHPDANPTTFGAISASHTINGHSIVLRLTYGRWRFLFAGDLNDEAERTLVAAHRNGELSLRSEVFKVPHHGSADFHHDFLRLVAPVASIVSSGDESGAEEHIHPRATLMSGLGRYGRAQDPVVFVTELAAFFRYEGPVYKRVPTPEKPLTERDRFIGFSRPTFGAVRVRTDGHRLLVYTESGRVDRLEAYAWTLAGGRAVPQRVTTA